MSDDTLKQHLGSYVAKLTKCLNDLDFSKINAVVEAFERAWINSNHIYFVGNGGSAGNGQHLANDFVYGATKGSKGLKVSSMAANTSVVTCLANDIGYDQIFSHQVSTFCDEGDILVLLSGSGNSPNVVSACEQAKALGVETIAITGFDGGKLKELADISIHTRVDDMQVSEDLQLIIFHMIMQAFYERHGASASSRNA